MVVHVLPPNYNSTNYEDCIGNNLDYCRITAAITPNEENEVWKKITYLNNQENFLDHSIIHRGLCIHDNGQQQSEAENMIKDELRPLNLTAVPKLFLCYDNNGESDVIDMILLTVLTILLFIVLIATVRRDSEKFQGYPWAILTKFSIRKNWQKMTKLGGNEDFEKLKSIQGVRVFTMIFILLFHVKMQLPMMYISNVDYLANISKKFVLLQIFDLFLTQIFFLISALLLTIQVYRIYEKNGKFDLNDVFVILLNRYFRLQATSAVLILLYSSNFWQVVSGPKQLELLKTFQNSCRNHWPATLFLYNNFYYFVDVCNATTWYSSVDFQMYVILTLILYAKCKYNIGDWTILPSALLASITVYALIIYTYNLDIMPRVDIRDIEFVHACHSESFKLNYSATYSNISTCIIGAIAGTVYYRTKNRKFQKQNLVTLVWNLCFLGLPALVILISAKTYKRVISAIIGSIVKPLFALAFAIGILGMSHNIGGCLKQFFENRYFLILSNFSYSVYLVNLAPMMLKIARDTSLVTVTPLFIFQEIATFVPMALIIGAVLTFLVEFPMSQIQKQVLPQIKGSDKEET